MKSFILALMLSIPLNVFAQIQHPFVSFDAFKPLAGCDWAVAQGSADSNLSEIFGASSTGISGIGYFGSGDPPFRLDPVSPVPEPSIWALLATGAILAWIARHRKVAQ